VGKDGEHYWYESVIKDHEGQTVITKMLVSGDPQNEDNLKRMILKAPGQPAMEMPIQMMKGMGAQMGGMSQGKKPELPETKTVDLGVESVTVPAGTFKANHWQSTTEDFIFDAWVSEAVSPYGMVKGTSTDFEMILLSHGDGATSLITEEPQSMTMPGSPMGGKGGE
jgi:hypothetical protein